MMMMVLVIRSCLQVSLIWVWFGCTARGFFFFFLYASQTFLRQQKSQHGENFNHSVGYRFTKSYVLNHRMQGQKIDNILPSRLKKTPSWTCSHTVNYTPCPKENLKKNEEHHEPPFNVGSQKQKCGLPLPGHLEKTFFIEAMVRGEVVGSIWSLLEADEAVEVLSSVDAEALVTGVRCSSADILGQAKRQSGSMASKLLNRQKEMKQKSNSEKDT